MTEESSARIERRTPRWERAGLAAICLLALGVRLWHLGSGSFHPDEPLVLEVVRGMRERGDWDTNWRRAELPENLHYDQFNFSGYLMAARLYAPLAERVAGPFARRDDKGWLWYRGLSAVLGAVAVGLVWLLARRLAGPWAAVFAGLGTALAPLLVQDSHYGRPEAFVTALFLAVAWLCAGRERPGAWRLAAAGFLTGVLVMTKVTLGLAAVFPLWAWLRDRPRGPAGSWRRWLGIGAGVAIAAVAGSWLAAPHAWLEPRAFLNGVAELQKQYATGHPPHSLLSGGRTWRIELAYFGQTLGLATAALAALGLIVATVRRQWTLLVVVFLPVVAMAAYFGAQRVFFERNLSHVVPLYFVSGGVALAAGVAWLRARMKPRWTVAAMAVAVLGVALWPAARLTHAFVSTDLGGRAEERRAAFEAALRARWPDIGGTYETLLLAGNMLDDVEPERRKTTGPLLLVVHDFHDEFTAIHLQRLRERYDAVDAGRLESVYGPLPVCTLLTYHNRTLVYLLIRGPR